MHRTFDYNNRKSSHVDKFKFKVLEREIVCLHPKELLRSKSCESRADIMLNNNVVCYLHNIVAS